MKTIKQAVNSQLKSEMLSLSQVCKFVKSEAGKTILKPYLDELKQQYEKSFNINLIEPSFILSHLPDSQKTVKVSKDSEQRINRAKWSCWLVLGAINNYFKGIEYTV